MEFVQTCVISGVLCVVSRLPQAHVLQDALLQLLVLLHGLLFNLHQVFCRHFRFLETKHQRGITVINNVKQITAAL